MNPALAYDGTNSKHFFRTPAEFFSGDAYADPADTSGSVFGVLDPGGTLRLMRASGHWALFPEIAGVGVVRQRYPIMPIHIEGNTIWKELMAIKDVLAGGPEGFAVNVRQETMGITLEMTFANAHTHFLYLDGDQAAVVNAGGMVTATSSVDNAHS